jgi:capsid protein
MPRLEAFVANAIGTGIKPQSLVADPALRERIQALWRDWTRGCRCGRADRFLRPAGARPAARCSKAARLDAAALPPPEDGLVVALQLQLLEPEHLPVTLNTTARTAT